MNRLCYESEHHDSSLNYQIITIYLDLSNTFLLIIFRYQQFYLKNIKMDMEIYHILYELGPIYLCDIILVTFIIIIIITHFDIYIFRYEHF